MRPSNLTACSAYADFEVCSAVKLIRDGVYIKTDQDTYNVDLCRAVLLDLRTDILQDRNFAVSMF